MSRSPAEAAPGSAGVSATELLTAVAHAYDAALQAAACADVPTCTALLDATEILLAGSDSAVTDAGTEAAQQAALAAHARLSSVLAAQHRELGEELGQVRKGKKALAGYGGTRPLGERIQSRV